MNEFMKENEVIGEVRAPLEHAAPNTEEKAEIKKKPLLSIVLKSFLKDVIFLKKSTLNPLKMKSPLPIVPRSLKHRWQR